MAHIAGVSTQINSKGVVTQITVDLKKHPQAKVALSQIGLLPKTADDLEREAFYKEFNDPTNMTIEQGKIHLLNTVKSLWNK